MIDRLLGFHEKKNKVTKKNQDQETSEYYEGKKLKLFLQIIVQFKFVNKSKWLISLSTKLLDNYSVLC